MLVHTNSSMLEAKTRQSQGCGHHKIQRTKGRKKGKTGLLIVKLTNLVGGEGRRYTGNLYQKTVSANIFKTLFKMYVY